MFSPVKKVSMDGSSSVFVRASGGSHHANNTTYVSVRFYMFTLENSSFAGKSFILLSFLGKFCLTEFMGSSQSKKRKLECHAFERCAATSASYQYDLDIIFTREFLIRNHDFAVHCGHFIIVLHQMFVIRRSSEI